MMEFNKKFEDLTKQTGKVPQYSDKKFPVVPMLLAAILFLLIVVIFLLVKSGGIFPESTPTETPTATVIQPSITPLPSITPTERPVGSLPEDAVNAFYSAVRDGKLNIILDEWTTSSLSNRLTDDTTFEEKYQVYKDNIEWEILEIDEVEYSKFMTALAQYENKDITKCELFDLADPESTGDHWRISDVNDASCEEGTKILLPTPTSTSVTYYVPEISWYPCPDTYASRLLPGMAAIVSTDPPIPNNLRKEPGQQHQRIGELAPGEEVRITEGPRCVDSWIWWYVTSLKNGEKGWTSEGSGQWQYWLVPSRAPGS